MARCPCLDLPGFFSTFVPELHRPFGSLPEPTFEERCDLRRRVTIGRQVDKLNGRALCRMHSGAFFPCEAFILR